MIFEITKEFLENIFPPFQLGDNRSLLECDFYNTHYCYFDQIDDDYLSAIDMSAEGLLLEWASIGKSFTYKQGLKLLVHELDH